MKLLLLPFAFFLIPICGAVVCWIIISTNKKTMKYQNTITSLQKQLTKCQDDLEKAKSDNLKLKAELEAAKAVVPEEQSLDKKYWQVLEMIQHIDFAANIVDPNIGQSIKLLLNQTLELYGYEFVDYSDQTKDYYFREQQPINEVKVTCRGLKKKDGSVALEGKVFIPEE